MDDVAKAMQAARIKAMQAARILRKYCRGRRCSSCFLENVCGETDPCGWEWPEVAECEENE